MKIDSYARNLGTSKPKIGEMFKNTKAFRPSESWQIVPVPVMISHNFESISKTATQSWL
jgi:hypothetical protein